MNTAAAVSFCTAAAIAAGETRPACGRTRVRRMYPFRIQKEQRAQHALCSASVLTTCGGRSGGPCGGRSSPNSAMFSASVQFLVKMTRSLLSPPKNSHKSLRQRRTFSASATDSACPLRPGLPQGPSMLARTARTTASGLRPPVAALSK